MSKPGAVVRNRRGDVLSARPATTRLCFLPVRPRPSLPAPGPARAATFIIPAYNAAATLAEAVASCFLQTVADVSVVVVDDGSTDATTALLDDLQKQYGDRFLAVRQENSGVSAARNTGLRCTLSPVVIYLDADDLAPPDRAALSLAALASADLVYGQEEEFDAGDFADRRRSPGIRQVTPENAVNGCGFRTGTAAARRTLHTERQVWFDERMAGAEDYELSLAALAAGATLQCLPEVLLWRRRSNASLRSRCDWTTLRNYAVYKHREFLITYSQAPLPLSAEQVAEVERKLSLKTETEMRFFAYGTAAEIADQLQQCRGPAVILSTEPLPPGVNTAKLLSCLADPSVGAAAPMFREGLNADQVAIAEADGYLRTHKPLCGCLALRRDVLAEVGGFNPAWGEAWPLYLSVALLKTHRRLLLDRSLLIEGKATVARKALAAFERTVYKLETVAGWMDKAFCAVVVADGAPQSLTAATVVSLLEASDDLEVIVVGGDSSFSSTDSRVLNIDSPGELAAAYNRGIRRGLGKYLLLLKSGDLVTPKYLDAVRCHLSDVEVAVHPVKGGPARHLAGVAACRQVFTRSGLWLNSVTDEAELGKQLVAGARAAGLDVTESTTAPMVTTRQRLTLRSDPAKSVTLASDTVPLVFVATCALTVTGGGQRPAQMARAAAALGQPAVYFHDCHELEWQQDNLLSVNREGLGLVYDHFVKQRGNAVYGLPDLRAWVPKKWTGVFDFCDDWEEFSHVGHLPAFDLNEYREVLATAPLVVCSAQRLVEIAEAHGAKNAILVRNGGPDTPLLSEQYAKPPDFLDGPGVKVCFIGSTWGAWLDWQALSRLAEEIAGQGGVINLVGGNYQGQMPNHKNVRWHGELPYQRAMAYAVHSDIGIIPFKNAKICASVDPVKYYDYVAAGCRVVATDCLTEMRGRDYCTLADPDELAVAVRKAAVAVRLTPAQRVKFCKANSWRQRTAALLEALK